MNRFSLSALGGLALLCAFSSVAAAQGSRPYMTRRVEDLGTFKVATKTWIPRESSFLGFNTSESIYDNTCVPETILGVQQINTIVQLDNQEIFADTGQIPSTSNTALVGTSDIYTVQGWRWAVCTDEPAVAGLSMTATIFFLESLASCSGGGTPAVTAPVLSSIQVTDIPTSMPGVCFIFDIDLTGSELMFEIKGDGDGVFDGTASGDPLDTFGVAMTMVRSDGLPFIGRNSFGLAGDPGTDPDSYGCQDALGVSGPGGFIGDSTSFQNPARHVDGSTGFGSDDFLEVVFGGGPSCFFIAGGYALSSPGLPNPWASLHCEIYGEPFIPPTFLDICNGDGGNQMGCTNCPCGNNFAPGTIGGCINSAGTGTRIGATGDLSASLPPGVTTDLRLSLTGAPPGALCVMLSGSDLAPQNSMNMCFGQNSGTQFGDRDGLRCAVMNLKRHGGRSANGTGSIMDSVGPSRVWGGEAQPNGGLWKQGGFVSGQTRYFQVTHRDVLTLGCMRGLNTSQAIRVTFTP